VLLVGCWLLQAKSRLPGVLTRLMEKDVVTELVSLLQSKHATLRLHSCLTLTQLVTDSPANAYVSSVG